MLSIGPPDEQQRSVEQLLSGAAGLQVDTVDGVTTALKRIGASAYHAALLRYTPDRTDELHRLRRSFPELLVVTIEPDPDAGIVDIPTARDQHLKVYESEPPISAARCILDALERNRLLQSLRHRAEALQSSEAKVRSIIDGTGDGILILGPDRSILFANPAAERLFARNADQLVGSTFDHAVAPGDMVEIQIPADGSLDGRTAELHVTDIDWEGDPARLVTLRDVTDRREAEERAQRLIVERTARQQAELSARRSQFLSRVSAVLDATVDLDLTLTNLSNLVVSRFADWCVIELLARDGSRRVSGGHRDPAVSSRARSLRFRPPAEIIDAGRPVTLDGQAQATTVLRDLSPGELTRLTAETGGDHPEEFKARSLIFAAMRSAERSLGFIVFGCSERNYEDTDTLVAAEIAERTARTVQNAQLYEAALAANNAKSDFLAIISHELRTPLNAILGYTQILLGGIAGDLDHRQKTYLQRIDSSAHHLLRIIEEILAFRMMEKGQEQPRPQKVSLRELIDEVAALSRPLLREKGLEFRIDMPEPTETLFTDAGKVRQILLSLLSNAAKFTEEGSVELHVRVADGTMSATVADTGIGIAPEHLGAIFESFWQAEPTYTRVRGGTGLGLSVARHLARVLGGDLEVTSEPGVGSAFTLKIPLDLRRGATDPVPPS